MRRLAPLTAATVALALALAACGSSGQPASSPTTRAPATPTTVAGPLVAPQTSQAQDATYLTDLARVDPDLSSYVTSNGDVALKALLTDGAAFCAFLKRGGDIDTAMTSLVQGAQSVEEQTHLPTNVTTFNAIDAVALVALCPDEQSLVPASDQVKIKSLAAQLQSSGGSQAITPSSG